MVIGVVSATTSPMPKSIQGDSQIIKQCNGITTSISDCVFVPCVGACRGLIYASTASSRCGSYCGLNTSLGNTLCSIMRISIDFQRSIQLSL